MDFLHPDSLADTIDALNQVFFDHKSLPKTQTDEITRFLVSRQDQPGAYAHMFAPTEKDFQQGIRFFTGEKISTRAGLAHILGEEACRSLLLLKSRRADARSALANATRGMLQRVPKPAGTYCCGKCSVTYWRHLAAGGLDQQEKRLAAGLKSLKQHRDGTGRWRRFPFYYTLLALTEIGLSDVKSEKKYAAPTLERLLKSSPQNNPYGSRRRQIAHRILESF
jgi:hypothetical protein